MKLFSPQTVNGIIITFIILNIGMIFLYFSYEPSSSFLFLQKKTVIDDANTQAKSDINRRMQEMIKQKNLEKSLVSVVNKEIMIKEMQKLLKNPTMNIDAVSKEKEKIDIIKSVFKSFKFTEHDLALRSLLQIEENEKNREDLFIYLMIRSNNYTIPFSQTYIEKFHNECKKNKSSILSLISNKQEEMAKFLNGEFFMERFYLLQLAEFLDPYEKDLLNQYFNWVLSGLQLAPSIYDENKNIFVEGLTDFYYLIKKSDKDPLSPFENFIRRSKFLAPKIDLTKVFLQVFPEKKQKLFDSLKKYDYALYEIIFYRYS